MALFTGTQESYYSGSDLGNYQFVSFADLKNNFLVSYVGEDKVIPKVKIPDVNFHIQRCIAELSYDTLRSHKSQEIDIPPTLQMKLPHDYVNYVKLSWCDDAGVERIIYPVRKTGDPMAILQDGNYDYIFDGTGTLTTAAESETWKKFKQKHHESRFTRFFEDYRLPKKFGYERRKAHFSSLILTGQMDRSEALNRIQTSELNEEFLNQEFDKNQKNVKKKT